MLLVSGATRDVMRWRHHANLGVLMTPRGGHSADYLRATGCRWAMDNDAFSGFDRARFEARLQTLRGVPGCLFVPCPDVVGDAVRTLINFYQWHQRIAALGFPVALVAQDGLERMYIPWSRFEALFIGGRDRWRGSRAIPHLIHEAHQRGKWVHWGRINIGSVRIAQFRGADSIDGSGFSRQPSRIPRALEIISRAPLTTTTVGAVRRERK